MKESNLSSQSVVLAITLFIAGVIIILYYSDSVSASKELAYKNKQIKGVVNSILGFNRGFPILSVNNKRIYIDYIPSAFGRYISPGDSISKRKGEFTVTSYRKNKKCIEIITWKHSIIHGYEQPDIRRKEICKE